MLFLCVLAVIVYSIYGIFGHKHMMAEINGNRP